MNQGQRPIGIFSMISHNPSPWSHMCEAPTTQGRMLGLEECVFQLEGREEIWNKIMYE